jgi:hypothetical protein
MIATSTAVNPEAGPMVCGGHRDNKADLFDTAHGSTTIVSTMRG